MVLVHQLGLHFLYSGLAAVMIFSLRGFGNRRRGLPFFHGWLGILRFLVLYAVFLTGWDLLPMRWHLPLVGVFFVVCMDLLFREALRPSGPQGRDGTKAGKGAA